MTHASALPTAPARIDAAVTRIGQLSPRMVVAVALLAAGFALGLALIAEHWGGLLPCSLCLLERWPYRVVIVLAALAIVAPRPLVQPLLWLVVLAMMANVGLAIIHVGVEQHLWQNPVNECAAPHFGGVSLLDRILDLSSRPPQPCDRATYLIPFLPLSMAAMNAVFAAALAGLLTLFLCRDALRVRRPA
ncbi:MAG TPA: disulfide bond formation protein B [Acetobacteraceae bacterium]|jgi:disulfide bond formation protein DsbB